VSSQTTLRSESDQIPVAKRPATTRSPRPSTWFLKVIQAVTGGFFALFVLTHLLGNLKVFIGRDAINHYAEFLTSALYPLAPEYGVVWIFRTALIVALVLHIYSGLTIWVRGRRARGVHGRKPVFTYQATTGRTMIWTGLLVFCFLVFHLLDLTFGKAPAATDQFSSGDPYNNIINSFERPAVAIFYMVIMLLLAIHLSHGIWSLVTDFGGSAPRTRQLAKIVAYLFALAVVLGNLTMPIAVMAGWLTL